jgi:hypothetical protein
MRKFFFAFVVFLLALPVQSQITLDDQIHLADQAFAKYMSTRSIRDLNSSMKLLMMVKLSNEKAYVDYVPRVADMWIELFRAVDSAYDPTFDLQRTPTMNNAPGRANNVESPEEAANKALLQKANDYWSLKVLDDTATTAVRMFVRYHYRNQEQRERLRQEAKQQGLSAKRIDGIFPL